MGRFPGALRLGSWLGRWRPRWTVVAIAVAGYGLGQALQLELWGLDGLIWLRGERSPPEVAVIVGLDRRSARALGLPPANERPWPRDYHARLIEKLHAAGAALVVMDLDFSPSSVPGAREPVPYRATPEDEALARAMAKANNVLLFERLDSGDSDPWGRRWEVDKPRPPPRLLVDAALDTAPFTLPAPPARLRQFWLYRSQWGHGVPTLPLAAWCYYRHGQPCEGSLAPGESWRYLDFYGPPGTVPILSYHRVYGADRAQLAGLSLAGKVVLVGYIEEFRQDRQADGFNTVFAQPGVLHSGVEILATAFANLVEDRPIVPLSPLETLGWLLVWGWGLGWLATRLTSPTGLLMVLGGVGLGYGLAIWGAFVHFALWLPLLVPLGFQLPATAGFVLWRRLWVAEQLRRQLEGYLPVWIKAWPTDARGMPTPANQEVSGVCLSTDLAGYTRISEGYRPTDLHTFVNDYFAGLFEVVYHHRGWVSDIKGDGMLALWVKNAPEVVLRQRACEAALAIVDALKGRDETQLPTRLGLHGGSVALGVVGSPRHWEFRAVGDPVNTVQRIQELNKSLKTQVLASRETLDGVEDVVYCPVGRFRLRGKRQILELVELWRTGRPTSAEQATIEACNNALACWRRGDFVAAQRGFAALASRGVAPAGFYLKRCHGLARQPVPKGWNGVVEGV